MLLFFVTSPIPAINKYANVKKKWSVSKKKKRKKEKIEQQRMRKLLIHNRKEKVIGTNQDLDRLSDKGVCQSVSHIKG